MLSECFSGNICLDSRPPPVKNKLSETISWQRTSPGSAGLRVPTRSSVSSSNKHLRKAMFELRVAGALSCLVPGYGYKNFLRGQRILSKGSTTNLFLCYKQTTRQRTMEQHKA